MASYALNDAAVAHARQLIDARQYVLDSDWGDVQPRAEDQNRYLESHSLGRVRGVAPRPDRRRRPTRPRRATPSSTATSAGSTAPG